MKSNRPYLLRALFDWITDNDCTPYIIVDAEVPGVEVPPEYVEDNRIVLNISPVAVRGLDISDDTLSFNGRFAGRPMQVLIPVGAVIAIYAKENGQGMAFDTEASGREPPPEDDGGSPGGGHLRVVK